MRTAVIIGATSGIGRAVAEQLLREGWRFRIIVFFGRLIPDFLWERITIVKN